MPDPNKVHTSSLNAQDFNLLLFFNFFISFVGSLFLAWNGVTAGVIYSLMFLGIMASIFMVMFFLKDDNRLSPITQFIKIPITGKLTLASFFYLIGMGFPLILQTIFRFFGSLSVTSFSVPLFGAEISGGQSFATAEIGKSMSWKIFNIMFTAGNQETLTYNFGTVVIGVLLGYFTLNLINGVKDLPFMSKKAFIIAYAFVISMIFFVISHKMNGSYGATEFLIAGIFLLIANSSIYLWGIFLSFWAGYHQINNLIWLVITEGLKEVATGFLSWFGMIYLIYLVLIIFYVINNWDQVKKDLGRWFNS